MRRKNIFFSTKAKNYNYNFIILCLPTNYEENKNQFNTSSLEIVAKEIIENNKNPRIVIKSTVPVGFTKKLKKDLNADTILFSPEFLREGTSLSDVKTLIESLLVVKIMIMQKTISNLLNLA